VTSNVEPEEVQAILDLTSEDAARPAEVAPRDFARPLRLSPDELALAQTRLRKTLPVVETKLARTLRTAHALEMTEAGEVNVEGLFADASEPLAVLCFRAAGQPGWLVWQPGPALSAIEIALGAAEAPEVEARPLTSVEQGMLENLLSVIATELAGCLGVGLDDFTVTTAADELGTWRDGGELADPRRLRAQLAFEGPGGSSEMSLYLPGVDPAAPTNGDPEATAPLPRHLEEVRITVAARLGQSDVPLADLLAIEVGDVIPLDAPTGEPLVLYVEDKLSARGVLGSKNGNLAVRVSDVGPVTEQN
jgi:flagellar motor switch protein FliM